VIPIHLDPTHLRIGLIGNGRLALNRYKWLLALACQPVVWSPDPEAEFAANVGDALITRLPTDDELRELSVLWIADLPQVLAGELAAKARGAKVVVNVEDDLPFCDFHTPALVKRGDLLVSIGTSGASPAAAGFVRRLLEAALPLVWKDALAALSALRQDLRRGGATPSAVIAASRHYLDAPETIEAIAPCGKKDCSLLIAARATPTKV
jgi:precorrin-2 dehydrogenase / sirohydrochlorin ferrochelatase